MSDIETASSLWPESLKCFDLTLPTVAENLALDEALLALVETDPSEACLRFWTANEYAVVLGRSNRIEAEVNLPVCREEKIEIFRRGSGGGTVLIGPGCLCYSLILPIHDAHRALGIARLATRIMLRNAEGLNSLIPGIDVCGISDLAQDGKKVSGNAQRWLKRAFIHHGTLLYDFDMSLLDRCLSHPSKEPDYRAHRPHTDFVKNIERTPDELRCCLNSTWNALPGDCAAAILEETTRIAAARYTSAEWHVVP